MKVDIKELINLYLKHQNITRAAREYCDINRIEYTDSFRRRCSKIINSELDFEEDSDNARVSKTVQYTNNNRQYDDFFMPSAWDSENNRFLSIDEYCDKYNLPKESVRSSKLIAHNGTHMVYNMEFNPTTLESVGIDEDFIEEVIKKHIQPVESVKSLTSETSDTDYFDRLVLTDIHIGMDVNGGRNIISMYEDKWDKEELFNRMSQVVRHILNFRKGSVLVIDDLGDYLDGMLGFTSRGGHELPQNMDDKEAFETAVEFKIALVEALLPYYNKIVMNSVVEDNHGALMNYFANSTIKKILNVKYSTENVEVNLLEKFINHYTIGVHTFLLSHGKDSQSLKFGFKPQLDAKQAEKIGQYCKEYNLYEGRFIEFSKGDSHLMLFDYSTSNDFDYFNYPSFSPPSNWVKTNFKKSKSGFVFFNIDKKSNIKITIPYWFL